MPTRKIVDGFRQFREKVFPQHAQRFNELSDGQQPEALMITCSDSRIDPALLTQTLPGDLFVLRNAGNIVGRYDPAGDGRAGTIEYAVKALKVKHIVVCGHDRCGAMAAVIDPSGLSELPAVEAWIRRHGPGRVDGDQPTVADQVRFNVARQLENLRTHPAVLQAEKDGSVELHGWVYDFVSGTIQEFQADSGAFVALDESPPRHLQAGETGEVSS